MKVYEPNRDQPNVQGDFIVKYYLFKLSSVRTPDECPRYQSHTH
ncbi:hypothetical protein SAMN06272722_102326 [Paenibacillus sp. RU5A]|nr:hypothetical protein SAMN03159332_1251 [Paenibacillus sp. 276b]SLJ96029.1 hypothetical protein SAMN06272722_102326 [Paenibacillus sp. RU5A]SOC67189.1 hypothetical protein SAMN05880581_102672 [Paenibacillus sp. RU26A]SOC69563.1 hypothetical protein SAMN05880586_102326 [Paenibacillus sp. RU5M]